MRKTERKDFCDRIHSQVMKFSKKGKEEGYIVVTAKFSKEGKKWTAYCEELGTATFGRSLLEAQERLKEAVLLHLNALEDVGERERFFRENEVKLNVHLSGGELNG